MDEDDWIANVDLESLERDMTEQQQVRSTTGSALGGDQDASRLVATGRLGTNPQLEACPASAAQKAACCESTAADLVRPFTAADLLKGTLPNHSAGHTAASRLQQGAVQFQPHQHWPVQPCQQLQASCAPIAYDWHHAACMAQAASDAKQLGDLQQQLGRQSTQQQWPAQAQWTYPSSMPQQQQHSNLPAQVHPLQGHHRAHQHQHSQQYLQQHQHNAWAQHQHQQTYAGWTGQGHQHQQYSNQQQLQQPQQWPYAQPRSCNTTQQYIAPQQAQVQQQHTHQQQQQPWQQGHHVSAPIQQTEEMLPRCPYKVCPGVFSFCGAALNWRKRKGSSSGDSSGFWGCSTFPSCDFKYFPAQQIPKPELGCEVVDEQHFRLVPQPAAEVAVTRAGGIRAVLAAAGVTLDHLEVKRPAAMPAVATATASAAQGQLQKGQLRAEPTAAGEPVSTGLAEPAAEEASAAAPAASTAEPALAAAPDFSWSDEDSLLLRLVDYDLVVVLLNSAKPPLLGKGGAIPLNTLEAFRSPEGRIAGASDVEAQYCRMPVSLRAALLPFQQIGVKFGLSRHGRVLIADEMGVGKTVQALALASCYQAEWPLLIVVPASLRLVWAEEIERWLPHVRPGDVTVIEGKEDRLCDLPDANARRRQVLPAITITSYEMLKRLSCPACQKLTQAQGGVPAGGAGRGGSGTGRGRGRHGASGVARARLQCTGPDHCMAALPWGVVIIDESHNLRTTNSRQADSPHTEAAVAAGKIARRLILLSGTPSLSRPYDLYRQVDVLVPGLLGKTKEEFAQRYCDRRLVPVITSRGETRLRWNNGGGARLVELHGLLVRRVMIRRLKKDVMAQLPPKRRQVVRLPYPPAHRWPKEREPGADPAAAVTATAAAAAPGGSEEQQQDLAAAGGAASAAAGADMNEPGVMSAAHRVALAKLPDVIDWLMAALGECSSSGSSSGGSSQASGRSTKSKMPAGPLRPSWKKDHGSGSEGQTAAAAASGSIDTEECDDADDDGSSSSGGSSSGGGSGPKFLVFAHHRDVMDKLAAALSGYGSSNSSIDPDDPEAAAAAVPRRPHRGVGYVRVDGSHDSTERLAAVHKFRSDPSIRVALLSITAAAVGLDFSSASMVVFVELPNEVSLVRQAEDRAHRKGQSKAVNVYFLCAQGTVDDKRWQALNISLSHVSQVHDGQAETLPEPLARAETAVNEESPAPAAAAAAAGCNGDGTSGDQQAREPKEQQAAVCSADDHQEQSVEQQQQQQSKGPNAKQKLEQFAEQQMITELALSEAAAAAERRQQQTLSEAAQLPGTPSKPLSAAAADSSGKAAVTPCKTVTVDLTADSPMQAGASSSQGGSSSSAKRKRQPLNLTPSKRIAAAAAPATATKSPAAAAAAMAAIAAADNTPGPCGKRQRTHSEPDRNINVDSQLGLQRLAADHADHSVTSTAAADPGGSSSLPEIWFEVSGHTNRLHYHLAADGSKPLGMNLPLDWLILPEEQGSLQQMAAAWDKAWQQQEELWQKQQQQQQQMELARQPQQRTADDTDVLETGSTVQRDIMHAAFPTPQKQQQQQQSQQQTVSLKHHSPLPTELQQQQPQEVRLSQQYSAGLSVLADSQQQQQMITQATPAPAAAAGSGKSSSRGRGAARPAISSLMLLPFTTPLAKTPHPAAAAAAVTAAADSGGLGAAREQQQQDVPAEVEADLQGNPVASDAVGGAAEHNLQHPQRQQQQQQIASSSSPGQLMSSPVLSQKLRRLLQQHPQQLEQHQPGGVLGQQKEQQLQPDQDMKQQPTVVADDQQEQCRQPLADQHHVPYQDAAGPCAAADTAAVMTAAGSPCRRHRFSNISMIAATPDADEQLQQLELSGVPQQLFEQQQGPAAAPGAQQQLTVDDFQDQPSVQLQQTVAVLERPQQQQGAAASGLLRHKQGQEQPPAAHHSAAGLELVLSDAESEEVVISDSQEQDPSLSQQQQQQDTRAAANDTAKAWQQQAQREEPGQIERHVQHQHQSPAVTQPQQQQQAVSLSQQTRQETLLPSQQQQQLEAPAVVTAAAAELPDCRQAPGFFGPSGLTCLTLKLTGDQLLELLRMGSAFAADWSELRSVTRNRLAGKVVPADLTAAVEAVSAAAAGAGAFGVGVVRYLRDMQEGDPNLPHGAKLETVTVHYPQGRQQVVTYRQAFTGPRTRHCINCFKVVEGASLPADAVLEGGLDLFCSLDCERLYYIKNSSSGIRRALFKLERGVCVQCKLDCHGLVKQLQQIGKDEPHWMTHRRSIVAQMAPRFMERGCATYLDKLINQATEGNAWHADHIIAVYEGGGGCDLDNLRTLCVPCHAAVTKQQAKARAEERQRRKLGTHDIRQWCKPQQPGGQGSSLNGAKPNHAIKRKRRGAVEQLFVDDWLSPEPQQTHKTAKRTAGTGAAPTASKASAAGAADLRDQQQQQQQDDIEVISIISSPGSSHRTAGHTSQQQQQRTPSKGQGTPTSAVKTSQDGQRGRVSPAAAVLNPPAAPRAAAAAAKEAAAAAVAAGEGRQALKGMKSVLDQFKCGGDSNQQQQQGLAQLQGPQPKRGRGRPRKCPAAAAVAAAPVGSGDAVGPSAEDADRDYAGELTAAERKQLASAAAQAAVEGPGGALGSQPAVPAAAAGTDATGRMLTSSSRKAARAAAAAMRNQLGVDDRSSSSEDEQQGADRSCVSGSHQVLQERQSNGAVTAGTRSGAKAASRVVISNSRQPHVGKQQQQLKRARGGGRARTVLDT